MPASRISRPSASSGSVLALRPGLLLQRGGDLRRDLAEVAVEPVVLGETCEEDDRLPLRRAVLEADRGQLADGGVRVLVHQLVQQRPDGVWRAKIPLLPGCVAEARSRDGVVDEIRAAARMYVEGLLEERIADEGGDSAEQPVEQLTITL